MIGERVRLRSSNGVGPSGIVNSERVHDHNKRPMYQVRFDDVKAQAMFAWAWFYGDDLTKVQNEQTGNPAPE